MYAINLTVNNWAVAGWAPYLVVAICMGLAGHRFGLPMTFRSCLYPILGEYTWGWIGDFIDGFTIVVTGMVLDYSFTVLKPIQTRFTSNRWPSLSSQLPESVLVLDLAQFRLLSACSSWAGLTKMLLKTRSAQSRTSPFGLSPLSQPHRLSLVCTPVSSSCPSLPSFWEWCC